MFNFTKYFMWKSWSNRSAFSSLMYLNRIKNGFSQNPSRWRKRNFFSVSQSSARNFLLKKTNFQKKLKLQRWFSDVAFFF